MTAHLYERYYGRLKRLALVHAANVQTRLMSFELFPRYITRPNPLARCGSRFRSMIIPAPLLAFTDWCLAGS